MTSSRKVYLNTASAGMVEPAAITAAQGFLAQLASDPFTASHDVRDNQIPIIRQRVADLFLTLPSQLFFIPNFSFGLRALATLLPKGPVLLYRHEYPALIETASLAGHPIVWFDDINGFAFDLEAIKQRLSAGDIATFMLSHVQWLTGYRADIEQLAVFCRAHDIVFVVDVTQSLGAEPINLGTLPVDALLSSNYKWMNAGYGTGIAHLSPSFIDRFAPTQNLTELFEPGHQNLAGLVLLEQAVINRQQLGLAAVRSHNLHLIERAIDGLTALGISALSSGTPIDSLSSILVLPDPEQGLYQMAQAAGISCVWRPAGLRLSFHYYNTLEDVDYLLSTFAH